MTSAARKALTLFGTPAERAIYAYPTGQTKIVEMFGERDNVCHAGPKGGRYAQIQLDVFSAALATANVRMSTIYSHYASDFERRLYARHGIRLLECRENVDEHVIAAGKKRVARGGIDTIILLGGDHIYASLIEFAQARGVEVQLWVRSGRVSQALTARVSKTTVIDRYLSIFPAHGFIHKQQQQIAA